MKVVIVGGVAGGATAAARLRRLDENAEIVLFERSGFISYANCGLPYYIGGVIEDEAELTLQTPERFYERFRVQVKVRHEVTAIDRAAHCVEVRDLDSGKTFREPYDKLLLATGAKPTQPRHGGDRPGGGVHAAHSGGHPAHPPFCGGAQAPFRRAGGGWFHRHGTGREPA